MKKKLFQLTIFLILLVTFACSSYASDVLIDWRYAGVVELYNYDLTEYSINSPIFERIILDKNTKDTVTEYISSNGYRVQSWNVPNDMNDLSNFTTFYREIPLEQDELYTVDGKKVVVSSEIGYEAGGEFSYYTFYTEDGVEVIQVKKWLEDAGVQFCVNTYYTRDNFSLVQFDLNGGMCEEIEMYNLKWNYNYVFHNETYMIPDAICWRSGYTFSHWTDGTNNYNPGDTYIMPDHDVTMTAVWVKDSSDFTVTLDSQHARQGDTVTLTVSIQDNPGMVSGQLEVKYDEDKFTFQSVTGGKILKNSDIFKSTHTKNTVSILWMYMDFLSGKVCEGDGDILQLTFKVHEDVPDGAYEFTVSSPVLYTPKYEELHAADTSGNLIVHDGIMGDVNKDGEANEKDETLLKQYFAGYAEAAKLFIDRYAADVNMDGKITRSDLMILSRYFALWEGYALDILIKVP